MRARSTVYCGIEMRSRLEARFARYLDSMGLEWKYEPRAYAGHTGQYLPDFEIDSEDAAPMFVEVKPLIGDLAMVESAMERIVVIWDSVPQATLAIAFGDSPHALVVKGREGRWTLMEWAEWGRHAA